MTLKRLLGALMLVALLAAGGVQAARYSGDAIQRSADRVIAEVWGQGATPPRNREDLALSTPQVQQLVNAMAGRYPQLQPLYEQGRVGLAADGYVAIPDPDSVPGPERNSLRSLVADENADRAALYHELALLSGAPQRETDIRNLFAGCWIQRAGAGWKTQGATGAWAVRPF